MTVPTGYRPERIEALRHHTLRAIADLSHLRCADPSAADATRSILLTRRNLEEHWMPLITLIRASDAMLTWTRSTLAGLRLVGNAVETWFTGTDAISARPTRYAGLSDDELIDQLVAAGHFNAGGPLNRTFGQSLDEHMASADPFWADQFPEMATEISRRVAADPEFAARAVSVMASVPLLGVAIDFADFPPSYVRDGLTEMLRRPEWSNDVYTAGVRAAAEQLLDEDRSHLLDVLLDDDALLSLMKPSTLDDELVTSLVRGGLYDAVMADHGRLADGAEVLRSLTRLANGQLDGGATEAAADAVADSMLLYIEHIAPGIVGEQEGADVFMVADLATRLDGALGTYPDVKDLFGMLLRHQSSRVTLALALDGYADHVVAQLGADIADEDGLEFVARFAELLDEAIHDEQLEAVMAAVAASARRQQIGHLIGFGAEVALSAAGIGSILRSINAEVIDEITSGVSDVDHDDVPDGSFKMATYHNLTLTSLELVLSTPSVRDELGLGDVTVSRWSDLERRLGEIAALGGGPERQEKLFDLTLFVREDVPELGVFLRTIRTPEVDRLLEATTPADLGDDG